MNFQINPEISKASTLPKEFYLEVKYFQLALNTIFSDSWQFITDTQSLIANNIYPFIFLPNTLDESLVLIKNQNKITCLSNVCTHRAHLVSNKSCKSKQLKCMYHGRTFNLDGSFKSMPGFDETQNFPTAEDNLNKVPSLKWQNLIFVSLKNNINLQSVFNDIENRIPNYPFNNLIYNKKSSQEWKLDAHWALYCENFLEGFHVPFVHKGLAREIELNSYETILINNSVLQIARCKEKCQILKNPKKPNDNIYALYYWIFPNLMLNFYSWGLSINIIEPISPCLTRIKFLSYPIKNTKQPDVGNATLEKVEEEDQQVVLNVQKGLKSSFYRRGRYSVQHEKGLHHFHLLLSKYLT